MPSGKVAKPDITDNKDGTVTVKYAPTEAGLHEMDIKYDGIHIPGKIICDWSLVRVAGKRNKFTRQWNASKTFFGLICI